jgi:hypothetical protein
VTAPARLTRPAPVVDAQAAAPLEALEAEAAGAGGAAQQQVVAGVAPCTDGLAPHACRART